MPKKSMPKIPANNVVPLFAQRFGKAPQINEMLKRVAKHHDTKAGRLAEAILFKALTAEIKKIDARKS